MQMNYGEKIGKKKPGFTSIRAALPLLASTFINDSFPKLPLRESVQGINPGWGNIMYMYYIHCIHIICIYVIYVCVHIYLLCQEALMF